MKLAVLGLTMLAMAGVFGGAYAQQGRSAGPPPVHRRAPGTIFQTADAAVPGYEVVAAGADFPVGATTGWHTHPGEMVGYVLEGTLGIEQEGRPAVTLNTGQTLIIPAGTLHNYTNSSRAAARMLATYFVEKGKPLNSYPVR